MPDCCPTCGERWCTADHNDPWEEGICLRCGASWQCACRGGGDATGPWRFGNGPRLREAIQRYPVDDHGNLPEDRRYRRDLREDVDGDVRYAAVSGGHVRRAADPTIWPRPGWREQAVASAHEPFVMLGSPFDIELNSLFTIVYSFTQQPVYTVVVPSVTPTMPNLATGYRRRDDDDIIAAVWWTDRTTPAPRPIPVASVARMAAVRRRLLMAVLRPRHHPWTPPRCRADGAPVVVEHRPRARGPPAAGGRSHYRYGEVMHGDSMVRDSPRIPRSRLRRVRATGDRLCRRDLDVPVPGVAAVR